MQNNETESEPMSVERASEIIDIGFDSIVGQNNAKRNMKDILLGPLCEDGFMSNALLAAPPGIGKTRFMRVAKGLVKTLYGRKTVFFESGKETGSPGKFFDEILIPHVHDKDTVLFIDEAHECPKTILSVLRDLLEPTVDRGTKLARFGGLECVFNPYRNAIIIATNQIDVLDEALKSRFERIDLEPYCDDEMKEILFRGLENSGIQFHENTLATIASCNRGTARDVVKWVNAIKRHLAILGKKTINKADVAQIVKSRNTLPLGVTFAELQTLLILEKDGDQQLKELAAKTQCSSSEQNDNERYLRQRGLITTEVRRRITKAGRDYLADLRDDKFIPELVSVETAID